MTWKKITSMVLLLCMLMSMFAMPGVGAAVVDTAETGANVELAETGWNVSAGTTVYFDATGWSTSGRTVYIIIGHGSWSSCWSMTNIANTNVYYCSTQGWDGATEWAFMCADAGWGDEGQSPTTRKAWAYHATSCLTSAPTNTLYTTSMGTKSLNYTQTATACYQSAGGGSYSTGTTGGTVSVSGYKLSGTTASATSSSTSGTGISAATGSTVTMKATANTGYTFKGWFTSTTATSAESTSATYTYTNTGAAKTLYAKFQLNGPYTVTVQTNSTSQGTVSTSSSSAYWGKTVTLTATPKTGYHLSSWAVTSGTGSLSSTTALKPTLTVKSNVTAKATFAANTGKVTFSAGTGGSVSSTGGSTTYSGTKASTASASTGYYFTGWTISGGTLNTDYKITSGSTSSASITIQPITNGAAITCKANFAAQYKITTQVNYPVLGSVTKSVTYVTPGNTVTITASPTTGNKFNKWTFPSGSCSYTSGSATSTSITIKPTSNVTVQGNFQAGLNVTAGSGGSVSPSGKNYYDYNTSVTLTATPSTGYHFTGWTFGGTYGGSPSTSSASTTIKVQNNTTATASFAINTYTVTFKDYNGTVLATKTVNHGGNATPPSNPTRTGYEFTGWSGTYTNVTSNQIVTATYKDIQYYLMGDMNGWGGTVMSESGNIASVKVHLEPGTYKFKLTKDGTWWGNDGTIVDTTLNTSSVGWEMYTSAGDCTLSAFGGDYTFNFNKSTGFLEVIYDPDRYTVSFFNWDGTLLQSGVVMEGANATPPANPTKAGNAQYTYTFTGWDKAYTNVQSTLDIFAQFAETTNKYTVTFKNWDGTTLATKTVEYGKAATAPSNPTRPATAQYTYTFTGWDKKFDNVTENITVTAQYSSTVNKYTVTFKNWDGTVLSTQTVEYGKNATAPSNPTRPATAQYTYTFSKWDTSYTNITGNTTVTAVYTSTVNKYTVTFKNWDGTVLSTQSIAYGSAATAPATPTKAGNAQYSYTFSGWDKDFSKITGNLTVTAQFTQSTNKYTVTFKNWDGTVLSTQSVAYGSSATAPSNPTRPATAQYTYTFTGWSGSYTNITGNVTVTAQYSSTVNKYTVTFKDWDGTELKSQSVEYGKSATAPANPTRPATAQYTYTFSKWDKDFSNITGNLTVTAVYTSTVNKYTVKFLNWDDTELSTQSVEYGSAATAPATPTKEGNAQYSYTFKGWDKDFSNITGNLTVKAQFTQTTNKYTVIFKNWDDSQLSKQSVEYGSAATAPTVPARDNFKFTGWDKDFSNITGDLTVTAQFVDTRVYIPGSFNGWATDSPLTVKSGDIVTTTFRIEAGTYNFKVLHQDVWYGNYGTIEDTTLATSSVGWEMTDGAADCTLKATGGTYTFNYNISTHFLEIIYTPDTYTVKFVNWDDSVLKTETVIKGQSATAPTNPTREATAQYTYTFKGWDKEFTNIQSDLTVKAQFTETTNKYTVTFKSWDGNVITTQSVEYGTSATAPTPPARDGYEFTSWDKDFSNVTGNITVTAQYIDAKVYLCGDFNNWGVNTILTSTSGNIVSTTLRIEAGSYKFKILHKDNWYGNWGTIEDTTITSSDIGWEMATGTDNCTLNATGGTYTFNYNTSTRMLEVLFSPDSYTVVFKNWDGTVLSTQSVVHGSAAKAPATPTRPATAQYTYTFKSWDTDFSNVTSDLTVKATYTQTTNKYTVTFKNYDGTVLNTQQVEYGKSAAAPQTPTKPSDAQYSYTFKAWDKDFSSITGNLTVTATYSQTLNKYTVTFVSWDGSTIATRTVEYGKAATAPTAPARAGYEFKGWDKEFSNITGNLTVTAQYTDIQVYLPGDFNGWTTDSPMSSKSDNIVTTTLQLEAGTYKFKVLHRDVWYGNNGTIEDTTLATSSVGWEMVDGHGDCTLLATGGAYTFNYNTETRMLEVLFESDSFTVTFVNWDGTVLKTESVKAGQSATAPSNPTRPADEQYTYTFKGWDKEFTNIQEATTVTATYTQTLNKYSVVFKDYDGTVISSQTVEHGKDATAPADPVRDGFEFTGWDKEFTNVTSDLTITAQYKGNAVFLLGSFNNWEQNTRMTASSGNIVTATVELAPGTYTFKILAGDAWYGNWGNIEDNTAKTSDIGWEMTEDAGDCTLTASGGTYTFNFNTETKMLEVLSEINYFKVTFVNFDGTELKSESVKKGSSATAPENPTRPADAQYTYTFKGWDKEFTNIQAETTVTATYTETLNKYTVTFVNWDGTELSKQTVEYGSAATAPKNPTREGTAEVTYTFAGWDKPFTNITGDTVITATYTSSGSTYTVTFVNWDDTVLKTETVAFGTAATAPDDPVRDGDAQYSYTFAGWDKSFDNVTGDITVTATYVVSVNKYTVTFVNYDGSVLKTEQVAYGSAATAPVNPTRPTTSQYIFKFDGWDKAFNYITGDLTVKATYTATVNSGGTGSNIYNLSGEVQKGQILQCWNWSYNNIKYNMQEIASQGFSAIQTSPIQATKETTREYYNTVWNSSWVVYQPVSFSIETNSFNALGTKSEFEAMCKEADKYGIKVIVDTIFNHTANDMSENTIHPWVPSEIRDNPDCWHDISKNIWDFGNRYDVTHYCLTGLPDLNTSNATVQRYCINFMKEAIAAGADGFRFDAAKHIETDWDADGVKSDFWMNVLGEATAYAQSTKGFTPYYYGEFIGAPEGLGIDAYTRYMSVTDTGANNIREAVVNGNASAAASSGITYGEAANKAVLWTESHDNYKDNGTRFISDHNINKTWALVGSRAEACGLYLARPSNIDTTLMGQADVTSWSYPEVRAINQFKNYFVGQGEYLSSYNNLACVERGTTGMVIVNVGGTYYNGMSAPVHTMEAGVYSDAITGNTFTVSDGYITGDIGDTGIAVVYRVGDNGPFNAGNPTEVSLVGSFNNWDSASNVFVANNKTTASTTVFLEPGTYTFKITTSSGLWYGNSGTITDSTGSTPWSMYTNVSDNCTLTASGGRYTFTFDSSTGKLSVEHQSTYDYNSSIYLKGSFNDWGTSNLMTYTGQNNIVTTTLTLDEGTYTFKLNNTDIGVWYGNTGTLYDTTATSAASGWVMSTDVSDNCTLQASGGTYTFNFNLSTNQLVVLYTPPTYTVTFKDWDGTVLSTQSVQKGQAASAPVSPSRESDGTYTYTFTGWDKEFSNITGDTVITAQYTTAENVYTVTFLDHDGIVLYYQVVAKGESATAPEDPVRIGDAQYSYIFAGWDGDFTNVQSDVSVTATYTQVVNEYTVIFKDYDGTEISTQKVAYGSAAIAPETPTREGNAQYSYTFKAWDVDFSEIKADLTVTATYTESVNEYTVTFKDFDGETLKSETVPYGEGVEAPENPTRQGFVFTGWDKNFDIVTEDITVYAQYAEDIVYLIGSFNDWTENTAMTTTETDDVVTATVKLDEGVYKFKIKHIFNWYGNTGNIEDTTTKTSDVGWEMSVDTDDCTLTASGGFYTFTFNKSTRMLVVTYISSTHTVTFLDYDGTELGVVEVDHEGAAEAPAVPEREGYLFAGWDKDITKVMEDMTVTATYVEATEEYTVIFKDHDGTVLSTQTVPAGSSATAPEAPARESDDQFTYTFKGWDKDFSRVVGDITVTAEYTATPHKFTVTFVDYDGTELAKVEVEYGKGAEAPEVPERTGFVFTGWDKDFSEVTEDITVTAQYKAANIHLMGSFNEWAETDLMTEGEEEGVVSVTLTLEAGTYYFKVKDVDTWLGNTGTIEDTTLNTSEIGWEMTDGADNCTLVATGGTYTFNYNPETKMLEVLFTPPTFKVTFVDFDGTVIEEVEVSRGQDATAPADPVRDGYKFIAWEGDFTNVQADVTITATYILSKITYTVTFLDHDGTVLKSQIVTTGEAAEAPEDPEREFYTFLGWDKDFSNITYNLTVNALYQDTRSYLTGSFNEWSKDTVMTENGNIVSTELLLRAGEYSFKLISKDTWYTNTGVIEDTTTTTSDIGWEMVGDLELGDCKLIASGGKYTFNFNLDTKMLEVIYTPVQFTVSFVDYDGSVIKEQTLGLGEDAVAPEVSDRNGFIFVGWDKEFEDIESDLTVNAVYIPNDTTYTVDFIGIDGRILGSYQVGHGQEAVAPEAPEVDGYVFVGWDETFDNITCEKTVTAVYKEDVVYIFGSFNEWAEGIKMTAGEGVHEYTLTLGKGTYYFKLNHIDSWFGNTGAIDDTTTATSAVGWEMVLDADNCTLNATGGNYTFRYNTETKMLEVFYEPLEYTVTFKGFDGEELLTSTVKLGDTITAPEAPAVEGYIFVGWDNAFEYVDEDLEINAVYIKDSTTYTVVFMDMDGTVIYTQEVEYGEAATAPNDPSRVGYIFTGWDKSFDKITEDTVITAQYKDNQIYLVGTFNEWNTDLHLKREGTTDYFSAMVDLEAGSYFFKLLQNDVWYTNASTIINTTKVTSDTGIELKTDSSMGDIILNASGGTYNFRFNVRTNKLEVIFYAGVIEKYTVTFVNWDGTVLDTVVVAGGKDASAPEVPTKPSDEMYDYIFAGWDKDFTKVTEDLTVTAQFTQVLKKFTVTFLDDAGNVIATQQVEYGKGANAPDAPVKDGFVFNGWDKDFSNITGDLTVTAKYIAGRVSGVTLAGTFNGWDASATPFLITTSTDKVSLQMKLAEGTYQFKVVENGSWYGNWGTIADTTVTTSATGWEMDPYAGDCTLIAGGGTYIFTYTISTHTLEVEYVGSEFKVTFVDWDGTVIKTEVVEPGGSATAPTGTFTRPDDEGYTYVFDGWDMDFTNVIAPLRVTAQYKGTPKTYTVTFKNWNGVVLKTQSVQYGTAATPPADPTRTGFIFSGWDGDINYITGNTTFTAQFTDNGVYIMGDFNDWQGTKLTYLGNNIYQGKIYLSAGQYKFKVKQGYDWYGNNGWIDDTTTYTSATGWEMTWDAGDCTLNASGSTYTFRYNASTRMLEVLYVPPTYTVTFKNWNGAILKTQYVQRGNPAYAPQNPTRAGYIFTGWDRDFSWIYENTVVTAQFALNTVSVMGDFNNWEGTGMISAGGSNYTATIELPAGTYKFKIKHADTWYGNGGTIENSTLATSAVGWEMVWDQGDCTLNAAGGTYTFNFNTDTRMLEILYKGAIYTVTFLDYDGSIISTQQVEYGKSATAPANPVREGYEFSGWSGDFSFITGNTTIMAQYGGETTVYLRGTFNNWDLTSPMKGSDTPKVYTYVLTLSAGEYTFKINIGDIWYGNNGTIEDSTVLTSSTGWDMDASAGDCKLVAKGGTYLFRFNTETNKLEVLRVTDTLTVTFVDHDGTVLSTQSVKYGDAAVAPTDLVRAGYIFVGWDKAIDNVTADMTVTALYRKAVVLYVNTADKAGAEMILSENGQNEVIVTLKEGTHKFNINIGGVVYSAESTFGDNIEGIKLFNDMGDCTIVATGGTYLFSFNEETGLLTVVKLADATDDELDPDNPSTGDEIDPDNPSTGDEIDPDNPSTGDEVDPDNPDTPDNPDNPDTPVVPEEPEIIEHLVVYVNPDGKFVGFENVLDGEAVANSPTPTYSDEGYIYTFVGWDVDLRRITGYTVATAVYSKVAKKFTVTFVDRSGNTIETQSVPYGTAATAPAAPELEGYTFIGWDKAFSSITGDITITARYKKNTEGESSDIGKLFVEVVSGSGFTISVNGATARPQGTSYYNSNVPMGTKVTLVANAAEGAEFLGWINANGVVLSTTETYTFVTTGNNYVKAMYRCDLDGASLVIFKNDKAAGGNGAVLDMQYYVAGEEIVIPDNPSQAGYNFAGWDMTVEEIKAKIEAGENVTVLAKWTIAEVFVNITVNGGTFVASKTNADGKIYAHFAVTATANAAPTGKKFAYWTDTDGKILSYNTEYKFYPSMDTEITAVYVSKSTVLDYQVLVGIEADPNADTEKVRYYVTWYVPEAELGYEFISGGVIIVDEANYNEDRFYHGSGLTGMTDAAPGSLQTNGANQTGAAVTKSNCVSGTTYYAKAWVIYRDAEGNEQIAYSDLLVVEKL